MFAYRSLFIVVVGCLLLTTSNMAATYWYSDAGLTPLLIDSSKVTIRSQSTVGQDDLADIIESIDRIVATVPDQYAVDGFVVCSLATSVNYNAFMDSISALTGIEFVEPYYLLSDGSPMLVSENVCIAFDSALSIQTIDSIVNAYSVSIYDSLPGMLNTYFLRNDRSSGMRVVELANSLYESGVARYSHPDFVATVSLDSYEITDYYSEYQWHSRKIVGDFNNASVWDFAGLVDSSITVAVFDDGVAPHEDMPANRMIQGYDFGDGDIDPSPYTLEPRYHGMACAGLIAATNSTDPSALTDPNSCVFSISPFVKIQPIKIFKDNGTGTIGNFALAVNWARQYSDVLSNSWSFTSPHYPGLPMLTEAIDMAYAFGRNGLGCPITWSAGNGGDTIALVNYPARLPQTFAVGAIDDGDFRYSYSSYGTALDIVAPSGPPYPLGDVWTLDQMGDLGGNSSSNPNGCPPGVNDVDVLCKFNGTSAAQPLVAGVAALILAKDPTLTASQVYAIMRYSAITDLESGTITPPDNEYGYGRVDAFRAILSLARGDCNNDGQLNLSDITVLVNHLFVTYAPLFPSNDLGDVNCDGSVSLSDVTKLSAHLFSTFEPLAIPCFEYSD